MEAQVQQLITDLNGKEPTRADVIKLLELIEQEGNKLQWVNIFANGACKKPEVLVGDINSYPLFHAKP